eukprot:scaffold26760_cov64-Phaeocystis_antarctica.AAC.1
MVLCAVLADIETRDPCGGARDALARGHCDAPLGATCCCGGVAGPAGAWPKLARLQAATDSHRACPLHYLRRLYYPLATPPSAELYYCPLGRPLGEQRAQLARQIAIARHAAAGAVGGAVGGL